MNTITAVLMKFAGEESSFWLLSRIVEQVLPGYFTKSMDGLKVDQLLLLEIAKRFLPFNCIRLYTRFRYLPKITSKLKELGFDLKFVTTKWFLCMFIGCLPWECTYRVLDAVLCLGSEVSFSFGF